MENATLTKELAPIKAQVSKAEQAATALQIKTADDMLSATELLGKIKIVGKLITEKKESIIKPLNLALKNARAFFIPIEEQFNNAEKIVKNKMVAFQSEELQKAQKKTEEIEEKVESGKMSFEKAVEKIEKIVPQKNITTNNGAIQFRTIKDIVIEDEKKLPREYLVPNVAKIRKVALEGILIPGVKVVEKQIVAGIVK